MDLAQKVKEKPSRFKSRLDRKILAMVFIGTALESQVTFEIGLLQMGGNAVRISREKPDLTPQITSVIWAKAWSAGWMEY